VNKQAWHAVALRCLVEAFKQLRRLCGSRIYAAIAASSQNILNKALVRLVYACAIEH
jgi:hypothetical protein